ncbi:hypothetical protein JHK87_052685 [Glycine soja]|nr:hypothetical protein JHK87_052685 [Glycine soja]
MQHYVAARPMFIDVEIMNADTKLVLGDQAAQASPSNVVRGLSSLYKEITESYRAANHCPFGQTVRETISCQFTFRGGSLAPISEYD